jgi:DNA-nicking Smr family endonuclease
MREVKPLRKKVRVARRKTATPHPNPPPQGGRESDKSGVRSARSLQSLSPSPLEGEGKGWGVTKALSSPNPGIDRSTAEKLRKGKLPIDRRLDLHGMTEAAAHAALNRCVRETHRNGLRVILVITGKGREGEGVLRKNLPRWLGLGENAEKVLRVTTAQPLHGGSGAFYVLLRRRRE